MISFDKTEIKDALSTEDIFDILNEWGGEPEFTDFGIISATICHNPIGEGSRKLYYYENSKLFICYTGGCEEGRFDIFELTRKIMDIQNHQDYDLNMAVRFIALKFGISGTIVDDEGEAQLKDWEIFDKYVRIQDIETKTQTIILKEYDKDILTRFNYTVKIKPWLEEDISQEVLNSAGIGYYPGNTQITIPHYDINNRLIGIRGRTLSQEDAEKYGKYRPLFINQISYAHPLGMNLYNLNNSKDNISKLGKVIIFESEKSALKYQSYFGTENDISVACCGSNISSYQMQLLLNLGAKEIIIAFDKQFTDLNSEECNQWKKKLLKIYDKYKNEVLVSFMWDKFNLLDYKSSPIDEGVEKFLYLYNKRIIL